jgi:hypothetical protein
VKLPPPAWANRLGVSASSVRASLLPRGPKVALVPAARLTEPVEACNWRAGMSASRVVLRPGSELLKYIRMIELAVTVWLLPEALLSMKLLLPVPNRVSLALFRVPILVSKRSSMPSWEIGVIESVLLKDRLAPSAGPAAAQAAIATVRTVLITEHLIF